MGCAASNDAAAGSQAPSAAAGNAGVPSARKPRLSISGPSASSGAGQESATKEQTNEPMPTLLQCAGTEVEPRPKMDKMLTIDQTMEAPESDNGALEPKLTRNHDRKLTIDKSKVLIVGADSAEPLEPKVTRNHDRKLTIDKSKTLVVGADATEPLEPKPTRNHDRKLTIDKSKLLVAGDDAVEDAESTSDAKTVDVVDACNGASLAEAKHTFEAKVHSQTDKIGLEPFTDKAMTQTHGSATFMDAAGIGLKCQKGIKPGSKAPNQDSWSVFKKGPLYAFGVFDGHGEFGHVVSNMVAETLPQLVLEQTAESLRADSHSVFRSAFQNMHTLIKRKNDAKSPDASLSGSTATIVVWDTVASKLFVSHVGDSGACLVRPRAPEQVKKCGLCAGKHTSSSASQKLTEDHKPELKDERKRIERNGGSVIFDGYCNHRVFAAGQSYPGLNMSRAFGDLLGNQHAGITCEPTVSEIPIGNDDDGALLLLCSDGVWEFMEVADVAAVVHQPQESAGPTNIAERLTLEARKRWIKEEDGEVVDDITALIIDLSKSAAVKGNAQETEKNVSI